MSRYDGFEQDMSAIRERNYTAIGAVVILIAQHVFSFHNELRFIWKRPLSYIKWLYIFLRYFSLVFQSFNLYLTLSRFSEPPFSPNTCRMWSLAMQIASTLNLLALDIVLMLRVYALYLKDIRIGVLMLLLFLVGIGLHVGNSFIIYTNAEFGSACNLKKLSPLTFYFISALVIMKTVIWGMTAARTQFLPRNIPVVQLVIYDGIWMIFLLWALYIANIPYAIATDFLKLHIFYICPITFFSITGCKLIINMQRMAVEDSGSVSTSDIYLTSQFLEDSIIE
ncbi:hypothetical protein BDQ17DRAFT_488917 [Cyathus striatus]|nr:hypothetical protein BDQ17DRAFT_488917 [Cyathus striatus]